MRKIDPFSQNECLFGNKGFIGWSIKYENGLNKTNVHDSESDSDWTNN